MRNAPVQVKKRVRLIRTAPRYMQVAEDDGDGDAEGGAEQRGGGAGGVAGGGLGRGPEEQRRLQALAADGEQGDDGERPAAGLGGPVDLAAQLAGQRRGRRVAIQKIIQVTKPTAMIESPPPISSWASKVRPLGPKVRTAPKASETTTAIADAGQTRGSSVRRSDLTR